LGSALPKWLAGLIEAQAGADFAGKAALSRRYPFAGTMGRIDNRRNVVGVAIIKLRQAGVDADSEPLC
jgi:hypothetical protein